MTTADPLKTFRKCSRVWEAEILRDRLETAGISAFVHGAETGSGLSHVGASLGGIRVQVPESQFGAASQVLVDDELQLLMRSPWVCPRCDEPNEASFEMCYSCSLPREDAAAYAGEKIAANVVDDNDDEEVAEQGWNLLAPEITSERQAETGNPYQPSHFAEVPQDRSVKQRPGKASIRGNLAIILSVLGAITQIPLMVIVGLLFAISAYRETDESSVRARRRLRVFFWIWPLLLFLSVVWVWLRHLL